MTHQEMKEEFKQLEGDPHVRSKIRRIREERARQYMEVSLKDTTVVVADSTYSVVALKYDTHMSAPVVTAKGTESHAQAICDFAYAKGIPIVENASLAHALYTDVKIHQEIPAEHYKAVAAVIGRVAGQQKE
jgi:flagellar biosynthetic protein FlhB